MSETIYENTTLYIRADMNTTIATGHVQRCLSIADAAKKEGAECVFLAADKEGVELISGRGYEVIVLDTDYRDMESELPALELLIRDREIRHLLVDSYQVTERYLNRLSELTEVTYLDDLRSFDYPVQKVLCYGAYGEELYAEVAASSTRYALGAKYAPVRDIYQNMPRKVIHEEIRSLLIVSGGTDQFDILGQLLEALELRAYEEVHVICGTYYEKYDALCRKFAGEPGVVIDKSLPNLKEAIRSADLVITAGGSTLYEIAACGTPAVSYSFVDNQLPNVKAFHKLGLIEYAGDLRKTKDFGGAVREAVRKLSSKAIRQSRSEGLQKLVDGNGARRSAEFILEGASDETFCDCEKRETAK